MKSEKYVQVRHRCNKFILITNLIGHHTIMDISNKTTEFICILGIVKETLNILLLCQWFEFLENTF